MHPAELTGLLAGVTEGAQHLAVEGELVDASGHGVRAVEILRGPRRDADRPRRPGGREGVGIGARHRAEHHVRLLQVRHVDRDDAEQRPPRVEHLDAPVRAVPDVDVALGIAGDGVQRVELARRGTALAPRLEPPTVGAHLHHARVVVAVGHVAVAVEVPRDVGRTVEAAPARRWNLAGRMRWRFLDGLLAPTEHLEHPPRRRELHDHVRPFIRRPDVAALVDPHGVREGEAIDVLADLAEEAAIRPELEELRRHAAVHRVAATGAGEDVDVATRIEVDAGHLA